MNQEFSHSAKPSPFLLKATTAVMASNTARNCAITLTLHKSASLGSLVF